MTEPQLRLSRTFSLPLSIVTEATAVVATRGAGKSSTGAVLIEEAIRENVPVVVFDWTGVFWGLRSSSTGDSAGLGIYVLGGPHGDVPLESSAGRFTADLVVDSGHSFVLDLSDFTKSQMRRFAADFLDRLYDRKARARTTLLLLIDEAHELAPQSPRGGFKGDAARLISAMEQVTALGRSRGIGVVMITQRTQALNKAVLDLIESLIVMRMLSPRAVAAVRDWILTKNEDDDQGVLASLRDLPTGTAWVWSPLRGILTKVAVRRIRTFDSYATPEPGKVMVEPKFRKALDLDALGEQMRATVERAKADDPAELRRRITALEREVTDARNKQPDVIERSIEILTEVVPQAALDAVDAAIVLAARQAESLAELRGTIGSARGALTAASKPSKTRPAPTTTRVAPSPPRPNPRPAPVAASPHGDVKLGKAERGVLTVLALHGPSTHSQIALLSGYSPKASTIGTALTKLRVAGFVEPTAPPRATQAGIDWLGDDLEPLPTGRALLDYWRDRFGTAERNVLDAALQLYPEGFTHAQLCELTGYSPNASTVGTALTKLRKAAVVDGWRISDEFVSAVGL